MTLTRAFSDLGGKLNLLRDDIVSLRLAAVEDRPLRGDWEPKLVSQLGIAADDIQGYLEQALVAASQGRRAATNGGELDQTKRALADCQKAFDRLVLKFSDHLFSYGPLVDLSEFERGREREWREWATVVQTTLGACQGRVLEVNQALSECWQELVERAGTASISMRATNIGQQISVPDGWSPRQEGVT